MAAKNGSSSSSSNIAKGSVVVEETDYSPNLQERSMMYRNNLASAVRIED